jgi:hypothetical protein
MKTIRQCAPFAAMTLLVFVGSSLLGLFGGVSTGPNVYCFIGLPSWAVMHRGSDGVSLEDFNIGFFGSAICVSTLITWGLSKILYPIRKTS